jgi:hypothetical protein
MNEMCISSSAAAQLTITGRCSAVAIPSAARCGMPRLWPTVAKPQTHSRGRGDDAQQLVGRLRWRRGAQG